MKKYITTMALALALIGCAGTSLSPEAKKTLVNSKGYEVNVIVVKYL